MNQLWLVLFLDPIFFYYKMDLQCLIKCINLHNLIDFVYNSNFDLVILWLQIFGIIIQNINCFFLNQDFSDGFRMVLSYLFFFFKYYLYDFFSNKHLYLNLQDMHHLNMTSLNFFFQLELIFLINLSIFQFFKLILLFFFQLAIDDHTPRRFLVTHYYKNYWLFLYISSSFVNIFDIQYQLI